MVERLFSINGNVAKVPNGTLIKRGNPVVLLPSYIRNDLNGANLSTYNFTGSELPATKIVVQVFGGGSVATSVVIGGVTAAQRIINSNNSIALYDAIVSAGNSGTVQINFTSASRCGIAVWTAPGLNYQTGASTSTGNPMDVSVATNAGDVVFVIAYRDEAAAVFTPTGYTASYSSLNIENNHHISGGFNSNATGGAPETFTVGGGSGHGCISGVYR